MKKIKDKLWIVALLVCICIILFAGYKIYKTYSGYAEAKKVYDDTADRFVQVVETPTAAAQDATAASEPSEPPREKKYAPIKVDFESLKEEYKDIVGWIYSPDTVINYPIVQGEDNDYYLRRMANGDYNYSGCIFMDYRCSSDFFDFNTVIYGHNMRDYSMFAPLLDYQDPDYFKEHPVMYLLTPETDYEIGIFSGYVTRGNAEIYDYGFMPRMKGSFLKEVVEKNELPTDIDVGAVDRTIMLSTCDYSRNNGRYVLIGTLTALDRHEEEPAE